MSKANFGRAKRSENFGGNVEEKLIIIGSYIGTLEKLGFLWTVKGDSLSPPLNSALRHFTFLEKYIYHDCKSDLRIQMVREKR